MKDTHVIKGIPASTGIAIGKAFVFDEEEDIHIVHKKIPDEEIKEEIKRYRNVINQIRNEMLATREKILKTLGKEHTPLCEAYLKMIEDPLLNKDVIKTIQEQGVNAEYALYFTLEKVISSFDKIEDEYFRERKNDIQYIVKRIIFRLSGKQKKSINEVEPNSIIIAHNINPADSFVLKERHVSGIAINIGGRTSHIGLFAQGLEIPAVVGLKNITYIVSDGDTVIIDGNQGIVIVNPDSQTLENYNRELEILKKEKEELLKLRDFTAQTKDGYRVTLTCNIETSEELKSVFTSGAEGIGLLRTEFSYLNRPDLPSEEELYEEYTNIVQKTLPYSVTIRTLDLGGDKLPKEVVNNLSAEANPFLGLRAVRLSLKYPEIFKTQIRAILRASTSGKIKIMYPMISSVEEFLQIKKLTEEVKIELKRKNIPFDENIKIGAMIEVPSAAITADLIAKEADFLSIGTNDLIQYTLAVDRMNETVAFMYEPLQLSILRLLKSIIDAGHKYGKRVAMCGEMAADITFTKILIGMGLDEFSMPPMLIPKIKKAILSISFSEAKSIVNEICEADSQEKLISIMKRAQIFQ